MMPRDAMIHDAYFDAMLMMLMPPLTLSILMPPMIDDDADLFFFADIFAIFLRRFRFSFLFLRRRFRHFLDMLRCRLFSLIFAADVFFLSRCYRPFDAYAISIIFIFFRLRCAAFDAMPLSADYYLRHYYDAIFFSSLMILMPLFSLLSDYCRCRHDAAMIFCADDVTLMRAKMLLCHADDAAPCDY